MWRPPINFITLHYAYILLLGLLAFPILYPVDNLNPVDTYHFGVSASTESGLNTVDLKELKTYQQLYLYFVPLVANIGFINIIVVVVRLWWYRKHLKKLAPALFEAKRRRSSQDEPDQEVEAGLKDHASNEATKKDLDVSQPTEKEDTPPVPTEKASVISDARPGVEPRRHSNPEDKTDENDDDFVKPPPPRTITFDTATNLHPRNDDTLYIPGPRDRDRGHPLIELNRKLSASHDDRDHDRSRGPSVTPRPGMRRRRTDGSRLAEAKSIDRVATVASSVFIIGNDKTRREPRNQTPSERPPALNGKPLLSRQATLGRNSQFRNLTSEDRDALGGIEYRSLKLLLKIIVSYFVGLHLLGVICLIPWIKRADPKYKNYLRECGIGESWWAIYSAQTMVDNLGFTLTPDSMVTFRDAEWPMFIMSFLAFAGNTFYPVFLRLLIWTMTKILPRRSPTQDPLTFLLDHPRRCYTLLFPSKPTWVLFSILFALNFLDTLLIIVLDLRNPEVAALPLGQRVLAAIFQAASARHTGTSTFVLSEVSPAVQFSLLVMMYISVFPIAISIRASNTYEERSLGIYEKEEKEVDEQRSSAAYLLKHMQNQLSFDLWYIFLGIFCISIAEADRIMDLADPAFNMFAIFFEVTSAYGNVGLSLGHPTVAVSLCGKFSTFSKIVICIMMIRGRHRGLPYQLDRAIMLPDEHLVESSVDSRE